MHIGFVGVTGGFSLGDTTIFVSALKTAVRDFIETRDWGRYHSPKNIAESICIEGAELLELFQWLTIEQSETLKMDNKKKQRIKEELSDVVIYCLSMSNVMDIDLSDSVLEKLELDKQKYPSDVYRAKLG
jgi:dCTP diphosphatase